MPFNPIQFTVLGKPQPAGSKRAFALRRRGGSLVTRGDGSPVINVVDDNANSKQWKHYVATTAREAYRGELLRGPLCVQFLFVRPRPKGHFNSHGQLNKKGLRETSPTTKPDVLKLARAVEDALTGVVWFDDAQIVEEGLEKKYGEPARVEVSIRAV